jgi:hypothetical protein
MIFIPANSYYLVDQIERINGKAVDCRPVPWLLKILFPPITADTDDGQESRQEGRFTPLEIYKGNADNEEKKENGNSHDEIREDYFLCFQVLFLFTQWFS